MTDHKTELEGLLAAARGRNNRDQVALANHMVDNAHRYLALMEENERLRGEVAYLQDKIEGAKIARQALGEPQ